jgi:lipoprotein-anchoring transpeptidase ErfK/SrfK
MVGMRLSPTLALPLLAGFCLFNSGCAVLDGIQKQQVQRRQDKANAQLRAQALAEDAAFRTQAGWKKKTWRNEPLLARATPENVSVQIALGDQRGLLLVHGAIAMDFPVASGKPSHPTPAGSFAVRGKVKDYHSNLYGKIVDPAGVVLVSDADTRRDVVPEGACFTGAAMPYWMRLTDTGVGMHVGYVPGGRTASHGCIRLKSESASKLFQLVKTGTPVEIGETAPALASK